MKICRWDSGQLSRIWFNVYGTDTERKIMLHWAKNNGALSLEFKMDEPPQHIPHVQVGIARQNLRDFVEDWVENLEVVDQLVIRKPSVDDEPYVIWGPEDAMELIDQWLWNNDVRNYDRATVSISAKLTDVQAVALALRWETTAS